MFCTNCGNKITGKEKFCTECGASIHDGQKVSTAENLSHSDIKSVHHERWWYRLAVVMYITAHLPLLVVVPLVWDANSRYYSTYSKTYSGSDWEAFGACVITIFFWVLTLRLIKLALRYVVSGKKPKFKDVLKF